MREIINSIFFSFLLILRVFLFLTYQNRISVVLFVDLESELFVVIEYLVFEDF